MLKFQAQYKCWYQENGCVNKTGYVAYFVCIWPTHPWIELPHLIYRATVLKLVKISMIFSQKKTSPYAIVCLHIYKKHQKQRPFRNGRWQLNSTPARRSIFFSIFQNWTHKWCLVSCQIRYVPWFLWGHDDHITLCGYICLPWLLIIDWFCNFINQDWLPRLNIVHLGYFYKVCLSISI